MTFSSATLNVNFGHNKFTSVSFKRFNSAYETLRVIDLSNNAINQTASDVFRNIPPNLEELIISDNAIRGAFPIPFPSLVNIRHFVITGNNIHGPLPDLSRATPRVKELKLSDQRQTMDGGLTETILATFSGLEDLLILNVSANNLSDLPADLSILPKIQVLDISSNFLSQKMSPELGKLAGRCSLVIPFSDHCYKYAQSNFGCLSRLL